MFMPREGGGELPRYPLDPLDPEGRFKCPTLFKVDVEGMEMKVLEGAKRLLDLCRCGVE
jgi:hypothetical protein